MPDLALQPQVITVSELNRIARETLERNLPLLWVSGEISNFRRSDPGHCYFTLKDAQAQVDCVMFRNRAQLQGWSPRDGMQVEVRAVPTLYEARGRFQLNVEIMRRAGLGALFEAFERLKAKLEKEGLFDPARKRPLPRFPGAVGVVTSPQAAALRDVLTTLGRRMPRLPVVVYPAPVQGEGAAERIAAAIAVADERRDCDVLIVCRGGGSIEDLWAFNEEIVAHAIAACGIPVVSGVGHETDFTIADFVADARAPTPTGAAEMASPDRQEISKQVMHLVHRLSRNARRGLESRMQRLDTLSRRLVHPGERIRNRMTELRHLASRLAASAPAVAEWRRGCADIARRLRDAARRRLEKAADVLARLDAHLKHLNPQSVLERGYSITQDRQGRIVLDAAQLSAGSEVKITFSRGWAEASVGRKGNTDDTER